MRPKPWKCLPILALLGVASFAFEAQAVLRLAASVDLGPAIFAIDNDATNTCATPIVGPCQLPDTDPAVGILTLANNTAAGGDLAIQISVQTQDIAGGPGLLNRLDTTGTQVTNNGAVGHAFSVAVSATDFAGPSVTASSTGAGQWSTLSPGAGFGGSSILMRWFDDPNNQQGALAASAVQPGDLVDTFLDVAGPNNPDSFSHNGGPFAVNDPGLFSMTVQFDGAIGPGVRLTGREQTLVKPQATVTVPAPATLLLVGSMLSLAAWRRFNV